MCGISLRRITPVSYTHLDVYKRQPVIGGSMKLENYDIVTIGSTKLMFVGLCGKDFNWGSEGKEHE